MRDGHSVAGSEWFSRASRRLASRRPAGVGQPDPGGSAHPGRGRGRPEVRPGRHGPPGHSQACGGTTDSAPWSLIKQSVFLFHMRSLTRTVFVQVEGAERSREEHSNTPVPPVTHTQADIVLPTPKLQNVP